MEPESSMSAGTPARIKAGLVLVFALALLSGLPQIVSKPVEWARGMPEDAVVARDRRFAELRKALPQRGTIGYVTDGPLARPLGDGKVDSVFWIARYCLAPLIVVNSTEPEIIVGDFSTLESGAQVIAGQHLVVIRRFENGVCLLRKGGT
jgi:hypothetical protein